MIAVGIEHHTHCQGARSDLPDIRAADPLEIGIVGDGRDVAPFRINELSKIFGEVDLGQIIRRRRLRARRVAAAHHQPRHRIEFRTQRIHCARKTPALGHRIAIVRIGGEVDPPPVIAECQLHGEPPEQRYPGGVAGDERCFDLAISRACAIRDAGRVIIIARWIEETDDVRIFEDWDGLRAVLEQHRERGRAGGRSEERPGQPQRLLAIVIGTVLPRAATIPRGCDHVPQPVDIAERRNARKV